MAENQKQSNQSSLANFAGKVASGARTAAAAAKAAGKAIAGDIAGAVVDVVKNPELMKAIVTVALAVVFFVTFIMMSVGTAIIQTIQMVADTWTENYMESITEKGLESNGNLYELFSDVLGTSSYDAAWNTIKELFKVDDKHKSGTNFGKEDYQTSVDAAIDEEAFAGKNGALRKRIDLIKGRIEERGEQIQDTLADYSWDATGLALALQICEKADNFFLYNGINSVTSSVDVKCFTMTDIQCIKILAAYCAQWECDIQSVDIWGLMNYLGWYDLENGSSSMQDATSNGTIYDTSLISRFTEEFYGAFSAGTVVSAGSTSSIELNAPEIPVWKGKFVPQYLLEEMAQLEKMEAEGKIELPRDLQGNIKWKDCCPNYEYDGGYGIIDYIFTGSAFASFSRTDYTGIDATVDEFLAELTKKGLKDIVAWWKELWGEEPAAPVSITAKKQGINQKCTVSQTIYSDGSPSTYSVNTTPELIVYTPNNVVLNQAGTNIYTAMTCGSTVGGAGVGGRDFYATDLLPNTEYSIYILTTDKTTGEPAFEWVDTFTTVFDTEDGTVYQAYKIDINIDVTYRARSVDELAFDIIGLWPSSLKDVEPTESGNLRAAGHADNALLKLKWRDVITDASGVTRSYEFERMRGNQYEYYIDYVKGVASTLNVDTTGLFSPEFNYGDNLVTIATDEYNYYVMNSEKAGYRYWDICSAVTGKDYKKESRNGSDWSAVFVMCCAYQCGYLGDNNCFGGFGCNASVWPTNCTDLYNGLREHSTAKRYETNKYTPLPGDLVFFSAMGAGSRTPDQVGVVVAVQNGKLLTIEGGSNNAVERCTYENYKVGSVAYTTSQGPMYISSYISPQYSEQFAPGTQYLKNHSLVNASKRDATQIHIGGQPTTTILIGAGRFRLSQLRTVLKSLEEYYPHLLNDYYADLCVAIDTAVTHRENGVLTVKDISKIADQWFYFSIYGGEALSNALAEIAARNYIGPVIERLKRETKFDWDKTAVRREILWQIVTSTDQAYAARQLLTDMVGEKDNNLTDEDLLILLMSPVQDDPGDSSATANACYLSKLLNDYRGMLWPEDHSKLQDAWIRCAELNTNAVREKFVNGTL